MALIDFFTKDLSPRQKQYEALRAIAFQEESLEEIADRFGYTPQSLRTLISRLIHGQHQLFPDIKRGPKGRHTSTENVQRIIKLRREKRMNSREIKSELERDKIFLGLRTVERILADAGFPKMLRRTNKERGVSKDGILLPQRSGNLDIRNLKPFKAECKVAGVFLFLPYILETGIIDIVQQCALPESSDIGRQQAALSMLLLKLIGNQRLSHIRDYTTDLGFGIFAGLNVLPKPTYMCSYSCRTQTSMVMEFQKKIIKKFSELHPGLYTGKTINLDFHSIPHFGDESEMDNVWVGTRGKAFKGANTFFAQDGQSDALIYTNADIKRSESSEEIKNFANYWLKLKGVVGETLVFDSKLTRYDILYELDEASINFITLRKKSQAMIEETMKISENKWEKIYLPIPKRKRKYVKVYHSHVVIIKGKKSFRQIIIKDHGRAEPTYIISNNEKMKLKEILIIYAKRWHIENKLAELVKFFSLNSLSSPIMVRIHFDILWTVIADTLYHFFADDLRRFENARAQKIFKKFVDMPGQIVFDGESFMVKIRKRATTPLLLNINKLNREITVPWLDNRSLRIVWTP